MAWARNAHLLLHNTAVKGYVTGEHALHRPHEAHLDQLLVWP